MQVKPDSIEVKKSPGKGRGIFCTKAIKEGQNILIESPVVIGPKQASPFVCVNCFDYINEQTVSPCRKCGLPLCPDCFKISEPKYHHNEECKLFEEAGKYKQDPITTYKHAKAIYMFLTPLRLLLKSETCPEVLQLDGKIEERADTSIYFLPVFVTKRIHKILGLTERFSAEQIQMACGILDTNCFEIKWDQGIARGLFSQAALINHDCAPNCRQYFDAHRNIHIMTCCEVYSQEELSLSYINPLLSTPMRQAILLQTKHFQCVCQRCQDDV